MTLNFPKIIFHGDIFLWHKCSLEYPRATSQTDLLAWLPETQFALQHSLKCGCRWEQEGCKPLLWFCPCPPGLCQLSSHSGAAAFLYWQSVSLLKKNGISCEEESRDDFPEAWGTPKHFNQLVSYYNIITGVLLPFIWVTHGRVLGKLKFGTRAEDVRSSQAIPFTQHPA